MSRVSACSWASGLESELVYRRSSPQDPEVERTLSCSGFMLFMRLSADTSLPWATVYTHVEDLPTLARDPADQAQQLTHLLTQQSKTRSPPPSHPSPWWQTGRPPTPEATRLSTEGCGLLVRRSGSSQLCAKISTSNT